MNLRPIRNLRRLPWLLVLLFVLKVLLTLPLCHEVVLELHVQLEAELEPQLRDVQQNHLPVLRVNDAQTQQGVLVQTDQGTA